MHVRVAYMTSEEIVHHMFVTTFGVRQLGWVKG